MNAKLFVGGLSYSTTSEGLRVAFSTAGTVVSADVIAERESGRSKGFGFVHMSTPEEAVRAIELWHDKELDGRAIAVTIARPKEDRPPRHRFEHTRRPQHTRTQPNHSQ
jgi:RNA recognition motif-containing protein